LRWAQAAWLRLLSRHPLSVRGLAELDLPVSDHPVLGRLGSYMPLIAGQVIEVTSPDPNLFVLSYV